MSLESLKRAMKPWMSEILYVFDENSCMVVGSLAGIFYGSERPINDLDVAIKGFDGMLNALQILKFRGFISRSVQTMDCWIEDFARWEKIQSTTSVDLKRLMRITDFIITDVCIPNTAVKVGLSLLISPYHLRCFERIHKITFPWPPILPIISLEDYLITKILAGREKDKEDIEIVLKKNPVYDVAYIKDWLLKLGDQKKRDLWDLFSNLVGQN